MSKEQKTITGKFEMTNYQTTTLEFLKIASSEESNVFIGDDMRVLAVKLQIHFDNHWVSLAMVERMQIECGEICADIIAEELNKVHREN